MAAEVVDTQVKSLVDELRACASSREPLLDLRHKNYLMRLAADKIEELERLIESIIQEDHSAPTDERLDADRRD